MTTIEAVIYLASMIAAGSLAIPGWLLNEQDPERRYRCRWFAFMALFVSFGVLGTERLDQRSWFWLAVDVIALAYTFERIGHWYRATEAIREAKRLLREKPSWLR